MPTAESRVERLDEVKSAREALASGDVAALKASVEELIDKTARFQDLWIKAEDRWSEGVTPWTNEIKRLQALLKAEADDPARLEQALSLHYGVRVAPVNSYCDAFSDWQKALAEKLADPDCGDYDRQVWQPVLDALGVLYIPIMKSNYLARRVYGGEAHRTEKCPVHKGRWFGCYPPDEPDGACACVTSGNTTGWLPA